MNSQVTNTEEWRRGGNPFDFNTMQVEGLYLRLPRLTSQQVKAFEDDINTLAEYALAQCEGTILEGGIGKWEFVDHCWFDNTDQYGRNIVWLSYVNRDRLEPNPHVPSDYKVRSVTLRIHPARKLALQETHDRRFNR